jgi:hypothetical protein
MAINGRNLVRKKYTWGSIAQRLLKVYENIVAGLNPNDTFQKERPKSLSWASSNEGGIY